MDARMVVVLSATNTMQPPAADYYIVRQSHAHAWVEVRTPDGWKLRSHQQPRGRDDPAGGDVAEVQAPDGLPGIHLANRVVAYDRDDQGNLIKNSEARLTNIGIRGTQVVSDSKGLAEGFIQQLAALVVHRDEFLHRQFEDFEPGDLPGVSSWRSARWGDSSGRSGSSASAPGESDWKIYRRRRRAPRAGNWRFYDDLIKLLERYNITRPRPPHADGVQRFDHLSANEIYDVVRRVTQIFYRIRYGNHQITYMQRQR